MKYYQKYLKYKNKYIQLKKELDETHPSRLSGGNKELSPFAEMLKKTNLEEYHDLFEVEVEDIYNLEPVQQENLVSQGSQVSQVSQVKKNKVIYKGGSKTIESWAYIIETLKRILATEGLSVKISELSDPFNPSSHKSDYGGVIFWHNKGRKEIIPGANAITVIIQDTRKWDPSDFGASGNGIVHNKLYKDLMGVSIHNVGPDVAACFSGFSFIYSELKNSWVVKFSSLFANSNTLWTSPIQGCANNSSKMTTNGEATAIIGAVNQWITNGLSSEIALTNIPIQWEGTEILNDRYQWTLHDYDREYPYDPSKWAELPVDPDPDAPHCS